MADINTLSGAQVEEENLSSDSKAFRESTQETRKTIEKILKNSDDKFRKRREELYFQKINSGREDGEKKVTDYKDLTVEQRREYDTFKIPDDEIEKMLNSDAQEIKNTTKTREDDIADMERRADALYEESQKHINELNTKIQEIEEKLNSLDPNDAEARKKLEDEKNEYVTEKSGWEKIMNDAGTRESSGSPIRKDIADGINNHNAARVKAADELAMIYPPEKVYGNEIIKNAVLPSKDVIERLANNKNIDVDDRPRTVEDIQKAKEQEKDKNDQELARENGGQPMNNNSAQPKNGNVATAGGDVAKDLDSGSLTAEEQQLYNDEMANMYYDMLGYVPGDALDFEKASDILDSFSGARLADTTRLNMLNNKEVKALINDALKKTGNNLNPIKARRFNKTRYNVLKLAKGPMMELALKSCGITEINNVKKQFKEVNEKYKSQLKEYQSKLSKAKAPEERDQIQAEIDNLNSKYNSIKNVNEFQNSAKQIKTIRSRIVSLKDDLLDKTTWRNMGSSIKGLLNSAKDEKNVNVRGNSENKDNRENSRDKFSKDLNNGIDKLENKTCEKLNAEINDQSQDLDGQTINVLDIGDKQP